jgi:nitrate reductase molybdenum cofactor assembly chaperone NarJ/NarW
MSPKPIPRPQAHSLRALAALLRYPDATLRSHLAEVREALHAERALSSGRLRELDRWLQQLARAEPMGIEADYVDTFDRSRRTCLHLFEHVHGDSRDRGPAMVDLAQTYERTGLTLRAGELPDHLSVVLEFASTQPPRKARAFLAETSHIVRAVFSALLQRRSPYATALAAVLELAGERAEPVDVSEEASLDDAWAEPEAFGGCSTAGQARPGTPQPIHIVKQGLEIRT